MSSEFRPVLYMKRNCPFCLKVAAVLAETGQFGDVELRAFWPGDEHEAPIRAELAPHLEKTTFPAIQIEPGRFLADSDAIVALFAQKAGVDPAKLPFYDYILAGPFPRLREAHLESEELQRLREQA